MNATDVIAAVDSCAHPLYRTNNDDGSWQPFGPKSLNSQITALTAINDKNIYLSTVDNGIFQTTDSGNNWKTIPILSDHKVTNLEASNTNNLLITANHVNNRAGVFKTGDNGANWIDASNGIGNTSINHVAVADSNVVYAISKQNVFLSINGGNNWQAKNTGLPSATSFNNIATTSAKTAYVATSDGVFKTTNGGESWVEKNNGLTNLTVNAVYALTTDRLFVATDAGIFRSDTRGDNWTAINNDIKFPFTTVAAVSSDIIYAGSKANGMYKSTNGGAKWTQINTGLGEHNIVAIAPLSTDEVYVGTATAGIFKTTNGGTNWTAINGNFGRELPNLTIEDIAVLDDNIILAATGGPIKTGVYRSTDGGRSWSTLNGSLLNKSVTSLVPVDNNTIFAGTLGAGVFKGVQS